MVIFSEMQLGTSRNAGNQLPYFGNGLSSPIEICIVGAGPVGMHFVRQLCQARLNVNITVFNSEKHKPYNRTLLSSYLAQRKQRDDLLDNRIDEKYFSLHSNCPIRSIDKEKQFITTKSGERFHYDVLVLATGSKVVLPTVPGLELPGVFTLRNLDDVERLLEHKREKKHIVILGGGLLGVETALAIKTLENNVTILDRKVHLLSRQINAEAGYMVKEYLDQQGLNIVPHRELAAVLGGKSINRLVLDNGDVIPCDLLIIAIGTYPNTDLARRTGLEVSRGIVVDQYLRTSDDNIFAIGECTEFEGQTFGIVGPGIKQAIALAKCLQGEMIAYENTANNTKLKISHLPIHSIGETKLGDGRQSLHFHSSDHSQYRNLIIKDSRVVGFIAVGEVVNLSEFQRAIIQKEKIGFLSKWRFKRSGSCVKEKKLTSIATLSDELPICHCNNVSLGTIKGALKSGCGSVKSVQEETGAGIVCGSCVTTLESIVKGDESPPRIKVEKALLLLSLAALVGFLIFMGFPGVSATVSVLTTNSIDNLISNEVYKQITGYSIVGLSILALLMSVKKRWPKMIMGKFSVWRVLHTTVSVLCVIVLVLHTGFYMGVNLNLMLMINFLSVLCIGGLSGVFVGLSGSGKPIVSKLRGFVIWMHILVLWPLLPLLMAHVLTVYYF